MDWFKNEWILRGPFGRSYRVFRNDAESSNEERDAAERLIGQVVWSIVRSPFDNLFEDGTLLRIYERFLMRPIEHPPRGPGYRYAVQAMGRRIESELRTWARMGRLGIEELPPPRLPAPPARPLDIAPPTPRQAPPAREPGPAPLTTWIGLALVDQDDAPVVGRAFSMELPDKSTRVGFFDGRGRVHLTGLEPGVCPVTFPDLDVSDFTEPQPMDGGASDFEGPVVIDGATHAVETGETLASIAERYGFLHSSTIWNRPENAELRRRRESPFVLLEDDAVFVPTKTPKQASCPTTTETKFVVYREKTEVRVRARTHADRPVKLAPDATTVDDAPADASLAGDVLVAPVPRDARAMTVASGSGALALALGELAPIRERSGVLFRLDNLGFVPEEALAAGDEGDEFEDDERLELGCELFQEAIHKRPTGATDDATMDALRDRAGA